MKKLINGADTVLEESLDGFAAAHADILLLGAERKFVRRRTLKPGKVALISGGGSGHEPLHAGFLGHGTLAAACPGQGLTSPPPRQMLGRATPGQAGDELGFDAKTDPAEMINFNKSPEVLDRENATVI